MTAVATEVLNYLYICGTCHQLYERGRPDRRNQACACGPRSRKTWPGHDFNEHAILCMCCGAVPVPSGSRWSPFFCRECQLMAMGVSLWHRRVAIPVGRHSLMHTFVPGSPPTTPDGARVRMTATARRVHATMSAIAARTEHLDAWAATCVADSMTACGLAGDLRLSDYLEAVSRSRNVPSRFDRFAQMCEFLRR